MPTLPRRPSSVLVCALLSLFVLPAAAEAELDLDLEQTRMLDHIVITGSRDQIRRIPGSAHALTVEDLDRFSHADPHRILRAVPGVYLHEEEGFGLFPHIAIRGTRLERSAGITLMEDGVLAAPAPYAASAAYYFPTMARMAGVEVRKGSSAIKYGPYTTGGALNMISTQVPETLSGQAHILSGSNNGLRSHAWIGDREGDWGWLVESWHGVSDGFKRIDTPRRTDHHMPRPDSGFDQRDHVAKLQWRPRQSDVHQELELKIGRQQRAADESYLGLTAADFRADPDRRYVGSALDEINTEHRQMSLRHYFEPVAGIDVTTVTYDNDFARNWYKLHEVWDGSTLDGAGRPRFVGISAVLDDPGTYAAELAWIRGDGGDGLGNIRANNRTYYSRGVQSSLGWDFTRGDWRHRLEAGVRIHRDEEDRLQWQDSYAMENRSLVHIPGGSRLGADSGAPGSTSNRVTEGRATALFVQHQMRYGNWTLIPGLRHEDISIRRTDFQAGADPDRGVVTGTRRNDTSVTTGGIGLVRDLPSGAAAFVGVHQGFAPPGADASLPEERSVNYEAGLRYSIGAFDLEVIGFLSAYDNLIGTCTASSGGGCEIGDRFDGGKVDIRGLELLARYDLAAGRGWEVAVPMALAYTHTDSRFRSAFDSEFGEWGQVERGDELPQIPSEQINLTLGLTQAGWALNLNANWAAETRATAGTGAIADNDRIDSRLLFDLSGEFRVARGMRLFASVENLTDETYVAARRPSGLRPGMPRTFWAGIKVDF
jgi:Fe(3+) dicitrate transport protein